MFKKIVSRFLKSVNRSPRPHVRKRSTQTHDYRSLEPRRLLAFVAGPMTTDLAEFQSEIVDTNVRIDNNTLFLSSQGETNQIEVNLRLGYVKAYQSLGESPQAMAFDFRDTEISRIVVVGNEGVDRVLLRQFDFANLQPGKLWARMEHFGGTERMGHFDQGGREIQVFATSTEQIYATAYWNDFYVNSSEPRSFIRINGSTGNDVVTVPEANQNNLPFFSVTRPAIEVTGDGYEIYASEYDDVVVRGNGGRDVAELHGTSGADVYTSVNNHSALETENWKVSLRDFAWERVNLHEGNDQARISSHRQNHLRQVGNELIGGGKRLTNVDNLFANLTRRTNDSLIADSNSTDQRIVVSNEDDSTTRMDFFVDGTKYQWRFSELESFEDSGL